MYVDEIAAAMIYSKLSSIYKAKDISSKLRKLAEMEARHAAFWRRFLERRGFNVDNVKVTYCLT